MSDITNYAYVWYKRDTSYLSQFTKEEVEKLDTMSDWKSKYPYISRNAGADILNAVLFNQMWVIEGMGNKKITPVDVEFLSDYREFAGDSLFCEWAYVIDLDNETFEIYKGFNKNPLDESDRFFNIQKEESEYKPVKLLKSYSIRDLPQILPMIMDCSSNDSDE